ncbi:LLM class flavin-dependent oxidoreductase [Ornithinibacillus californiensis]|uniref:LLM class flavin-dependent oxidoreductase n=1 Tax=Ornithinibacillus californiensis TaxID=161536 RepID=UPI00064DDAD6|nr:LLM class flavin-dependent oxidoreductase [Ornithinibacillus californiensis]
MGEIKNNNSTGMELGIYTLGDYLLPRGNEKTMTEYQRIKDMVNMAKIAEDVGLDVFGVGESHQERFVASTPQTILAHIAGVTNKIKLISASTVLSTLDPVRVYEDFSTLDLLSDGRAEIVAGRGSRYGAYQLFGYDLNDFDELFEEKFELLLQLNDEQPITWNGKFRPALNSVQIYPKPLNGKLPIWRAVGQHFASAIQAGKMGVPMNLAALYGASSVFEKRVTAYRNAAQESGHDPKKLPIGVATMMYIDKDSQTAFKDYYAYLNNTFSQLRGVDFPKEQYRQATNIKNSIMVGSPQQIVEKILYQHELFGHQRFIVQMDHGNIPYKKVVEMIEMFATEVVPAIRKATRQ